MTRNMVASVQQRLLNRAHAENRQFNELLQRYVLERFLYRLGESPYAHQFVLKGAMMLLAWQGPAARPTRDIDMPSKFNSLRCSTFRRPYCKATRARAPLRKSCTPWFSTARSTAG